MASSSKSLAWNFFKVRRSADLIKATCNLCDQKISRGNKQGYFNTTNMLKHLEVKHSEEFANEKIKRKNEEKKRKRKQATLFPAISSKVQRIEKATTKQLTLQASLDRSKSWNIHDDKAKKVYKHIAKMIAADLQPFSIVEDIGFLRLLKAICPSYEIPSRKFIKETAFQIYDKVFKKVQLEINSAPFISMTSDCWTASTSNSSFISFTAH